MCCYVGDSQKVNQGLGNLCKIYPYRDDGNMWSKICKIVLLQH